MCLAAAARSDYCHKGSVTGEMREDLCFACVCLRSALLATTDLFYACARKSACSLLTECTVEADTLCGCLSVCLLVNCCVLTLPCVCSGTTAGCSIAAWTKQRLNNIYEALTGFW